MKTLRLFTCLFFLAQINYAQDFQLSNPNQSLIYTNPSFAGSNGGVRNQTSYRNQWPLLSSPYVTYLNSVDFYLKPLRAGIAVSAWADGAAGSLLRTNAASLTYAQYLNFGEGKLQIIPSAQFAYGRKTLDVSSLNFGDPADPRLGFVGNSSSTLPDSRVDYAEFSAGFLTRYKQNFYAGAYLFHINQPDVGFMGTSRLPARLVLHASYTAHITDMDYLQFFYKFQQQQNFSGNQFALNLILRKHFVTGMSYVSGDALLFNLGYRSEYFSFTVGYDMVVSRLAGNSTGSWEAHLSFDLRKKDQRGKAHNFEN